MVWDSCTVRRARISENIDRKRSQERSRSPPIVSSCDAVKSHPIYRFRAISTERSLFILGGLTVPFEPTDTFLDEEDGLVLRLDETSSPQGAIDVPGDDQEEDDVTEVDARVVVGTADVVSTLPGLNLFRTRGTVEFLLPAAAAAAVAAAGPFFLFLFPSVKLGFLL